MDNVVTHAFIPMRGYECGHMLCESCADEQLVKKECHECRQPVYDKFKVYYPNRDSQSTLKSNYDTTTAHYMLFSAAVNSSTLWHKPSKPACRNCTLGLKLLSRE